MFSAKEVSLSSQSQETSFRRCFAWLTRCPAKLKAGSWTWCAGWLAKAWLVDFLLERGASRRFDFLWILLAKVIRIFEARILFSVFAVCICRLRMRLDSRYFAPIISTRRVRWTLSMVYSEDSSETVFLRLAKSEVAGSSLQSTQTVGISFTTHVRLVSLPVSPSLMVTAVWPSPSSSK